MIELIITNDDGEVVVNETRDTFTGAAGLLRANAKVIANIEEGGRGMSVCPDCATEYPFGEDPEADKGSTCGRCLNGETEIL